MAAKKKPPKKAAKKRAKKSQADAKKGRTKGSDNKAVLREKAGKAGKAPNPAVPKGKKLSMAEKSLRDSLIVQRLAQGWQWNEIAHEAGLTIKGAQAAWRAKRKVLPMLLGQDPLAVVERIIEGFQASIGDHEKMAVEFAAENPAAAVAAKKGADEARRNLVILLQSIGFLPHELGTIRWLTESRQVVEVIVAELVAFEANVGDLDMPDGSRKVLEEGAGKLRTALLGAAQLD